MTAARSHPDLWYPIAQLLAALRALLRATAPEAFAGIARDARAQLIVLAALVRRYIHILAVEVTPPPPRRSDPQTEQPARPPAPRKEAHYLFPLIEALCRPSRAASGEDSPEIQWALLMEAVGRLAKVLADPAPHARRLARRFGTLEVPGLRDLPVPWHITRRLPPEIDVLICRADQRARPMAWAGLDTS